MAKLYNLARMTSATTGTGTLTLGSAVSSYLSFADAGVQNGDVVTYAIADGVDREIGRGTYTSAGTTLSRTTILESTNGGSAINCSGNQEVFITAAAEDFTGFYRARVNLASDLTAQNFTAETPIPFDAEVFDRGGFHDNATNNTRITIPAGLGITCAMVTGSVHVTNDTADRWHSLTIKHYNSADVVQATVALVLGDEGGAASFGENLHSGPVECTAGDYFTFTIQTESDTSTDIEADNTYFSIIAW